jgi:hypothetical protein
MGESAMAASWGEVIYWAATIIASLIVVFVVWGYVQNTDEGYPVIPIVPLLFAGAIWLAGRACRNVFTER